MKQRTACKYYDECSAPLCPLLPDELIDQYIWYPDEGICLRVKNVPDWVKKQRLIAKKCKPENQRFYFTLEMLRVLHRVSPKIRGLNPDVGAEIQLKRWFKEKQGKKTRTLSEEQREKRREIIKRAREAKQKKRMEVMLEMDA